MIFKNKIISIILAIVFLVGVFLIVKTFIEVCNFPLSSENNIETITEVSPEKTISPQIKKIFKDKIEQPKIQIIIPEKKKIIGKKATQNIIVTDVGNTLVVTTYKIDWGCRFDPKLYCSYNKNYCIGAGISFFRIGRFNSDFFASYEFFDKNIDVNLGVSFQITNNTFVGLHYNGFLEDKTRIGIFASMQF